MDGLLTPEDRAKKYNVYMQCSHCADWTLLKGENGVYGYDMPDRECAHCGGTSFIQSSIISERTFDPVAAKKKKSAVKRKMTLN